MIQTNNFNEGTTIAKVANTEQMIFKGQVKEYEVSKLEKGLSVEISTSMSSQLLSGNISEVSMAGENVNGMILLT